jgi:hypothetical protein
VPRGAPLSAITDSAGRGAEKKLHPFYVPGVSRILAYLEAWSYPIRRTAGVHPSRKTVDNGYVESFNGRPRDECLNVETFFDLPDVGEKLWRWRSDYNQVRPHSALADRSPEEFAREWKE